MDDNNSKILDKAYNLHVSGKFDEAKILYEQLLQTFPDDINILNLYAQLNVSLQNYSLALELFNKLYDKTHLDDMLINISKVYFYMQDYASSIEAVEKTVNKNEAALRLQALAYLKLNNIKKAIDIYLKLIEMPNAEYTDYLNLSINYNNINDTENALKYALKAYELNPNDYNVNLHTASLYDYSNDSENALKFLLNVSKIKPDIKIFYRIGILYKKLKNDEAALNYFNAIIGVEPDNKKALLAIASIFQKHDKNVTIDIYKKVLSKYPNEIQVLEQLFITQINMMSYIDAYDTALKLIQNNNDEYEYKVFAADALMGQNKYTEALKYYLDVLKINPKHEYSEIQVAYIYSMIGKDNEAADILKKHLDNKSAVLDYTLLMCKNKQLDKVVDEMYAHVTKIKSKDDIIEQADRNMYRLKIDEKAGGAEFVNKNIREATEPKYNEFRRKYKEKDFLHKDISGKRLLLYNSGGIGDIIMFARYIKDIKEITSNIILQVPQSVVDLFKYNFPDLSVVNNENIVDASLYDYTGSIYGLFCFLNLDFNNIKYSEGYFNADENLVIEKSQLFNNSKKNVGLFWQGNPLIMAQRSVELKKLIPLLDRDDIDYYSLQVDKIDFDSENLKSKLPITDLAKHINNYSDTAALLKNLDLLISIDTSISNLAGALGVKTYLMLPFDSEWRWFHDTVTTPWYNSVKIFKQTEPKNWDEVVQRIKNEL